MKYSRKKPDMRGRLWTESDKKTLQRLLKKYGEESFEQEYRKALQRPNLRGAGREKHSADNLFAVYLALHEPVLKHGLEQTCKELTRNRRHQVKMPNGVKAYTWRGLKTLYKRAEKMVQANPNLAATAKMAEDLRSGRVEPISTVTDEKFSGPAVIPSGTLIVPELRKKSDR
jgi:hypothetical protein